MSALFGPRDKSSFLHRLPLLEVEDLEREPKKQCKEHRKRNHHYGDCPQEVVMVPEVVFDKVRYTHPISKLLGYISKL